MRSAMLVEPCRIELKDVPTPEPGPGEVLIRVKAVGICGSDVHIFVGRFQAETRLPTVLGHEFAGEVAALGSGVTGLEVGMRVACAPDRPCGSCEWCLRGETNVCPNVRFAASHGEPGCLCDYFAVRADQVYPIDDALGFEAAALCEPMAVGFHVVENMARPHGGETYAIMGAGPEGLAILLAARCNGAARVFVSDLLPERLNAAEQLGADVVCNVANQDLLELIKEETGGRGVDIAIEAAGAVQAIQQTFLATCIHGKAIAIGIPPTDTVALSMTAARRKELIFITCRRTVGKYRRALEFIASGQFDPGVIITHRFPFEAVQEAFECSRDRADGVIKAVVTL